MQGWENGKPGQVAGFDKDGNRVCVNYPVAPPWLPKNELEHTLDLEVISASRQKIETAFFQHLRQVLDTQERVPQNSESLVQMVRAPRSWWLARGALRIEQAGRSLLRAIGALPARRLEVQQHQSSQEDTAPHR
jgi:type IV pilus biogenesis protein CpaD/CtpE